MAVNWKKIGKIFLHIIWVSLLISVGLIGYLYYQYSNKYKIDEKKYPHYIGYLDGSKKQSSFERCDKTRTFGWFASAATYGSIYNGSKSKFKRYIQENFTPVNSTENGFLNLRFIINCQGEVGNMEINELDEYYKVANLSANLTEQLIELSSRKENWTVMEVDDEKLDSYMYLIFKIKNGNVVEILP